MRIAMVGPFGFRPKKTMRSRAFQIGRRLVQRGHNVHIIMPPWHTPEEANRQWQEDGVTITYTAVDSGTIGITRNLIKTTLDWQPDVVHCFKPKAYSGLVAEWLWRTQRKRIRLVVDSDDWEGWGGWNDLEDYPRLYKHFFAQQEQWGMRHCHALTVASRALETLAWGHGVPREQVVYLPNGAGIDWTQTHTIERNIPSPTILLYTRFFEYDAARLVAIIERVHSRIPDLRLLLVGASLQAEHGQHFVGLMANKGLSHIVDEVGWVEEDQLPAVLLQSHVGIYPMDDNLLNRTKCPVKLVDMLALGLPVVAEAVGQVTEYVQHGQSGFVTQSGDVDTFANYVVQLLQDAVLQRQLGDFVRRCYIDRFDWEQTVVSAEKAYTSH